LTMQTIRDISSKTTCRALGGAYELARRRFPAVVRIETTNACNARCVICPHHRIKRPIRTMDDGLFTKIIDECAAFGCKEVHLHNFGEPLLDKRLEERICYAKSKALRKVRIFSNGSLINRKRARGLIEAGLDEIKISLDGATREEFERIRVPLKFDRLIQNIKDLVAIRNEMRSPLRICVTCCSTSNKQDTMRPLKHLVDDFSFAKIHNWAGESDSIQSETGPAGKIRKPCSRVWRTFTILANGDVALCCLDYDGQFLLGRIDDANSIDEVFNGAAYRKVRLLHTQARQAEISLCRDCTKSLL